MKVKYEELSDAIGGLEQYAKNCHAASLACVKTGLLLEGARVGRGFAKGVGSQHSWVYAGNPYDPDWIMDPTLWSYTGSEPKFEFWNFEDEENPPTLIHRAHGQGSVFSAPMPPPAHGDIIELEGLSEFAETFLEMASPVGLDIRGWHHLLNGPMQGWPSKEIVSKAYEDKRLRAFIPVDIVGMLTDHNPGGMYF